MGFLWMIMLVFLFSFPHTAEAQDDGDVCDISDIRGRLEEVQSAQQNGDVESAIELLASVVLDLDKLIEACSVQSNETPEVEPTETSLDEADELRSSKDDGFYLVGIDIAPGRWESTGEGDNCYWERNTREGDIIDNHYGTAGGTVTISEDDFQIEFDSCGTFVYVEDRVAELEDTAYDPKETGFHTVGIEIAPGLWRSTSSGDGCYYARLDAFQDIIDNHYGNAGITVLIDPTDYEIEFGDCGTWEYLGE